jgi:hypothetical protein
MVPLPPAHQLPFSSRWFLFHPLSSCHSLPDGTPSAHSSAAILFPMVPLPPAHQLPFSSPCPQLFGKTEQLARSFRPHSAGAAARVHHPPMCTEQVPKGHKKKRLCQLRHNLSSIGNEITPKQIFTALIFLMRSRHIHYVVPIIRRSLPSRSATFSQFCHYVALT